MILMGIIKTRNGAKIYLYRTWTKNNDLSQDEFTPEDKFAVGKDDSEPNVSDNDLQIRVPITEGTVNDNGANELTGELGGDNTTDNTEIFKPGALQDDNTAQNLNCNDTDEIKSWFIDLSNDGNIIDDEKIAGLWLYFNNNVLEDITDIQIRVGSDNSNYYYYNVDVGNMQHGWNWIVLGVVSELDEEGSVSGDIDYFNIRITTENASDIWDEEDVVYDLLRTYTEEDTFSQYVDGYPMINFENLEVTKQGYLTTTDAVGFNLDSYGDFNNDKDRKMGSKANFPSRSKTQIDEIILTVKERIIL